MNFLQFLSDDKSESITLPKSGADKFSIKILLSMLIGMLVIISLSFVILDLNKKAILKNVKSVLETTLYTTVRTLDIWINDRKNYLTQTGKDSELVSLTQQLLRIENNKEQLTTSYAQIKVKTFFSDRKRVFGKAGFFLISPDGISIASSSAHNLGASNIIFRKKPELFKRVMRGETIFIPPIKTDVTINDSLVSMFILAPVWSTDGVIAAVSQRLVPEENFSPILQLGQLAETGETYAFNRHGLMISNSRFEHEIADIGLISTTDSNVYNIEIRDPGGDLTQGFKPKVERKKQPLTLMVQSAIKGESNTNIEGYNDYRGVPVYGTWLWDDHLGIGLATEINVTEAQASYQRTKWTLLSILGITLFLVLIGTIFSLFFWERAHRALAASHRNLEGLVEDRTSKIVDAEQQVRQIIDCAVDAIMVISKDNIINVFSPSAEKIFGYKAEDVIGKNANIIITPEFRGKIREKIKSRMDEGFSQLEGYTIEVPAIRADGTPFPCDISVSSYEKSEGNLFFVAIMRDITARKKADEKIIQAKEAADKARLELSEKEERFRALANNISQLAWMTDAKGKVTWFNQRWYEYTDTSVDDLKDGSWKRVYHPDYVAQVTEKLIHCIEHGEVWEDSFPICGKDGEYRWFLSRAVPVRNQEGEITRWFGTNTDITESLLANKRIEALNDDLRQQASQLKSATQAKSEFIANMSHEIRTPMNAVIGFTDITLKENDLPKVSRTYIEKANSSAKGLLGIINDILDYSKIDGGKLELEEISFNLPKVISDVLVIVEPDANKKSLKLTVDTPKGLPNYFNGDPTRIRQILLNLVGNSIKFTEKGGVTVTVVQQDEKLHFSVSDTGIGMTPEQTDKVFNLFTQAEQGTTRRFGGTGLGTTISKRLVEAMDGEIWIESELNVGSTFHFIIPLKPSDKNEVDGILEVTLKETSSSPRLFNILLAEDNALNGELVEINLKHEQGHQLTWVTDGQQAVDIIKRDNSDFDIILMDFQMPVLDGISATKEIRAWEKEHNKNTPIIALTASASTEDKVLCESAGMNDFVIKPINFSELCAVMEDNVPSGRGIANKYKQESDKEKEVSLTPVSDIADISKGLLTWLSATQYAKALSRFSHEHGNDGRVIKQLLTEQQTDEALRKIHTLKGLSLGLEGVTQTADDLEGLIKAEETEAAAIKLAQLNEVLDQAISAIEKLEIPTKFESNNEESAGLSDSSGENKMLNIDAAQTLITALIPILSRGEDDSDLIDKLSTELNGHIDNVELENMVVAIDDFDHDAAVNILLKIAKDLGLKTE